MSLQEYTTNQINEFITQSEKRISILYSQIYSCSSPDAAKNLEYSILQYRVDIERYKAELKNRDIDNYYKPIIINRGFRS